MSAKPLRKPSMDDINAAIVAAFTRLHEDGVIDYNDPKNDKLFDDLSACLEKYFNYPDYANYN